MQFTIAAVRSTKNWLSSGGCSRPINIPPNLDIMDIFCRVTPYGLVPVYGSDCDLKQRLHVGSTVRCRVTLPRNYEFHKKFFALVRLTYDNLPLPLVERWNVHSTDDMLRRFKRDLGYYQSSFNELGEREIDYKSISFAAMDQSEFEKFYEDCVNLVLHKYIPGIARKDLLDEIEHFK